MTTSAAENLAGAVVQKKEEKVEKRRALGRGLESLLPGPRVVAPGPEGRGALAGQDSGDASGKQVPHFVRNDKEHRDEREDSGSSSEALAAQELEAKRAGAPAPHDPSLDEPDEVISIQAVAEKRIQGNLVAQIAVELI